MRFPLSAVPFFRPLILVFVASIASRALGAEGGERRDYLLEANRAQIVMLESRGLVPRDEAIRIARALRTVADELQRTGNASANYLDLEERLSALIGTEASDIHIGRSRNDLGETMNRIVMRERLLQIGERIAAVRASLHRLAAANLETVMPGFTHGVQAQPTTVAHFILGFDASLGRDSERLRQAYERINRSPLGVGAFTTSGFNLDRPALAQLLGFSGLVENGYDAIMVSSADTKVEFSNVAGLSALNIGRFAQYLLFQYDDPAPGIVLAGTLLGRSSIMPQKRNPSALERLRLAASEVTANAQASALFVHNTPLFEVKEARDDHVERLVRFADAAVRMYDSLLQVIDALEVHAEGLREQVERDYATMTELADTLHREAGVAFRVGYKVASELTNYGRQHRKRPSELTLAEVAQVYRNVTGDALPLSETQFRRSIDPLAIVQTRQGLGGPQPGETRRLLTSQQEAVNAFRAWIVAEHERHRRASEELRVRFAALTGP